MAQRGVFYSWQDNSDSKLNRYFIGDCLERAIKKVNRHDELADLVIDRDTKSVPGMPDIGQTVFDKIEKAAVVVADLTIINPKTIRRQDEEPTANPNVLFELGYAFGKLGPKRLVGVINAADGEVEELPFDSRPKRLMTYRLNAGDDKAAVRKELIEDLVDALQRCLGDSEAEIIALATRASSRWIDISIIGSEIADWHGIPKFNVVLSSLNVAAQEAYEAIQKIENRAVVINTASAIAEQLSTACKLVLNEENWPSIQQLVSSSGEKVKLIDLVWSPKLDDESHAKTLDQLRIIPSKIDELIASLPVETNCGGEIENFTIEFRRMACHRLLEEHPLFIGQLRSISIDCRKLVLEAVKQPKTRDEVAARLKSLRDTVQQLLVKYL